MCMSSPGSHTRATSAASSGWRWVVTTLLSVFALGGTAAAVYYAIDSNRLAHYQTDYLRAQEAAKHVQAAAANIEFDQADQEIPRCAKLTGRAEIIPDQVLWLAHRNVGDKEYWLRRPTHTSEKWEIGKWNIGTDDKHSLGADYEITGLYVDRNVDAFLGGMKGDPHGQSLPPSTRSKNVTVHRSSDPNSPACTRK
jgi:hypothetical protein